MAPATSHKRSHSLLLLQKLLSLRDTASPLTLILDDLEQPARPVVSEFLTRAKISKTKVIFLSFCTLKPPSHADAFIKAAGRSLPSLRRDLLAAYPAFHPSKDSERALVVIDSLNALASSTSQSLAVFLSSVITPAVSVVGVYHVDVPVLPPLSEYEPDALTLLTHLATAIVRLSSLRQEEARARARDRSLAEPEWGLREGREGVLVGLPESGKVGVVVGMELRRRSGRTVAERFVLLPPPSGEAVLGTLSLLADHLRSLGGDDAAADEEPESTFDMGLTEKQRRDREGVVLPYFDAQTDVGAGEGGRILYDMGREDDFDDEEDEL